MIVRFWGVRGSVPVPGPDTVRVGGNTSCVSLSANDQVLILDAGTGIRSLGEAIAGSKSGITILCSHLHWDHVMGIPFFAPLYEEGRLIHVVPLEVSGELRSPLDILDGFHFPKDRSEIPANCQLTDADPTEMLEARGFSLSRIPLNHPGGSVGYRVSHNGHAFVYMTDNELDAPEEGQTPFEHFVSFCAGADVLCHDAQYIAGEMRNRWGWGHSMVARVCELAIEARVKHLVLFHHDPARTDSMIVELEERAQSILEPHGIRCTAAFEGLEILLG